MVHLTCVKYNGKRPDDVYYYTNVFPHDSATTITIIWITISKVGGEQISIIAPVDKNPSLICSIKCRSFFEGTGHSSTSTSSSTTLAERTRTDMSWDFAPGSSASEWPSPSGCPSCLSGARLLCFHMSRKVRVSALVTLL